MIAADGDRSDGSGLAPAPVAVSARLPGQLQRLAEFNDDVAAGGITREVFTPTYGEAIAWVAGLMEEAGLSHRFDAFGNLCGEWRGTEPAAPRVMTGSHVDTTLNAGAYDGVLGVLGAIEAVRRLRDGGFVPQRTLEIVAFAGEEPRFVTGCLGSRAMFGDLEPADLEQLRDRDGVTLAAALRLSGFDPDELVEGRRDPSSVASFVELHIEQGSVLEDAGKSVGVVTAIAAPHDFKITVRGAATHAGATPMRLRRDALVGAAEIVVAVERAALASPSGATVGTVGVARVSPGANNVVPGEVEMEVDVRDSDPASRERTVAALKAEAEEIARQRQLELVFETIVEDEPVRCDATVVDAVAAACAEAAIEPLRMTSGAYHDAMVIARSVPTGMIFVPSVGGVSHHPDEFTEDADLENGVRVLAGTLRRLASG